MEAIKKKSTQLSAFHNERKISILERPSLLQARSAHSLSYEVLDPRCLTDQLYSRFTRYQKYGSLLFYLSLFYGGGYVLGMGFKLFLLALSQGTPGTRDIDLIGSNLKMSTQTRLEYSGLWAQIRMQGHHFGVFGSLICLFEQPMELITGCKGFVSGFFGGGLAGSLVSWQSYHQSSRFTLFRRFLFQGMFIGGISYYMIHRS